MSKRIGIASEGPTDYLVLKTIIDRITGEDNQYLPLQPEPDMAGRYGNGWKGVWKWCKETPALDKLMDGIWPKIDIIAHGRNVLDKTLGETDKNRIVITIPCDSTDTWIVAAYDDYENIEQIEDPWKNIIAKGKYYHDIRVRGDKKNVSTYSQFAEHLANNWDNVTGKCVSAKYLESDIRNAFSK